MNRPETSLELWSARGHLINWSCNELALYVHRICIDALGRTRPLPTARVQRWKELLE